MTQPQDIWTVKAALDWTRDYLEQKGAAEPLISARMLLSHATGLTHLELYTMFDRPLSADERACLREGVARRAAHEPIQYITGRAPFRYIELDVRPGVLIPRPETEMLVDVALQGLANAGVLANAPGLASQPGLQAPLVADICTGSGNVACSVAHEVPDAEVWATDISADACQVSLENARRLGLDERVHVREGDLTCPIPDELHGSFVCVISNPPYVPEDVWAHLPDEVREHEPKLALAAGEDGLDVFRRLLPEALKLLKGGGLLAVELHEEALDAAVNAAIEAGFADVQAIDDLTGRPRILSARKEME
ncbi:MAG: peptide chain release factor N(5)-glutamine methyltransferase [Eggerthellaceae bacterium]|nr:peptide chain release factor N(5)-glutamine methyltransferase [Eggerthellaceae bacterium]